MRCRYPLFPALSVCLAGTPLFFSISPSVAADSIVVNGKHYDNIYLGVGTQVYYIQNPADGSMITVPKADVHEKDIVITPDREQRRKLRDQWRQRRMNKTFETSATTVSGTTAKPSSIVSKIAHPPAPKAREVVKPVEKPVVISGFGLEEKKDIGAVIGNIPPRGGLKGRKIFMDAQGTPVLTNKPEDFSGRPEYVEVTLHYEQIEVPERFRTASKTPVSSTVSKKKVNGDNSVDEIVDYYAGRYVLDKSLIYAIIKAESGGNRYAVSSAGARGLMQLMPGTAREMGVKDIFDPAENIAGGTQYLAKLLNLFDNNTTLALAGYNAGPGNVKKYGGVPPFKETQDYVRRVKQYQKQIAKEGGTRLALDSSKPVDNDYLPPESKKYYMIVLDNGLTVAAEQVYPEEGRYVYIFKGRSGHFAQEAVVQIIEPS